MIISKSKKPSLLLDLKSAIICSLGVYLFETSHIFMMIILLHPSSSTEVGKKARRGWKGRMNGMARKYPLDEAPDGLSAL